jgi:hypothetical protein
MEFHLHPKLIEAQSTTGAAWDWKGEKNEEMLFNDTEF